MLGSKKIYWLEWPISFKQQLGHFKWGKQNDRQSNDQKKNDKERNDYLQNTK